MANVVVHHVVYGWKPCHSSSSTPCAPSKTHRARAEQAVQVSAVHDGHRGGEGGERVDARPCAPAGASSGPTSAASRSRSAASFAPQRRRVAAVRDPGRVVGVGERVRHRLARPPCRTSRAGRRPRAISRAWLAARWYGVASSAAPSTVSRSNASATPERRQVVGLGGQRQRVDHHEPRQVGRHAGRSVPGAELGERVVRPSREHDVVRRLRAPVEPHHRGDRSASCRAQPVDDGSLAGVPVPEVDHDRRARHSRSIRSPVRSSAGSAAPVDDRGRRRRSGPAPCRNRRSPAADPTSARSSQARRRGRWRPRRGRRSARSSRRPRRGRRAR